MRSQMPMSFFEFGRDDKHASAAVGELMDELVNFEFGANVDATGGFIEEQNFGTNEEPFGEDDFLLIAAAESADGLRIGGVRCEADGGADLGDGGFHGSEIEEAGGTAREGG